MSGKTVEDSQDESESSGPAATPAGIRKWLTRWLTTAILVPVVVGVLGVVILNYWNRPQLSVSVAKALVSAYRIEGPDGVHEYRMVLDMLAPCLAWLNEYSAATSDLLPQSSRSTAPRLVYGIYLENVGRSELTNIRISFRSHGSEFEVTSSPQLSLSDTRQLDPKGDNIHIVTIASMGPGTKGAIIGVLPGIDGHLFLRPDQGGQVQINYEHGDMDRAPRANDHVRFAGSAQLSDTSLMPISVNEFFVRQKEAFGLTAIHLPLEPIELSAKGGQFAMRLLNAPFMGCSECPVKAPRESYEVSIVQWGATDTATPATESTFANTPH